jgi:single-strand DNA-binding protein
MGNINQVILTGRLGADAELKYTPTGTAIIDFRIAVSDYQGKEKDEYTNWIDCTLFQREKLVNFLKKGSKITLTGKLRQSRWQNTEGKQQSRISIIVDSLELPEKSKNDVFGVSNESYEPTDDIPF